MKKHWYRISLYRCPVCGSEDEYRTREYGEKPEDPAERYWHVERYDWCDELGAH